MPAASEPALPQTWRPLGTRMARIAPGALLFFFCGALWVLLSPALRDGFSLYQRVTLLLMVLRIAVAIHALVRARAPPTDPGLTRNTVLLGQSVSVRLDLG